MKISAVSQYNYFKGINSISRNNVRFAGALSDEKKEELIDLRVFHHHIYEYQKGLRSLILTTEKAKYRKTIENRLKENKIDYTIHELDNDKINVFFGTKECIDVIKTFNPKLNKISPEQDFMLGIMLGYDKVQQCKRYLQIKNNVLKLGIPEE